MVRFSKEGNNKQDDMLHVFRMSIIPVTIIIIMNIIIIIIIIIIKIFALKISTTV